MRRLTGRTMALVGLVMVSTALVMAPAGASRGAVRPATSIGQSSEPLAACPENLDNIQALDSVVKVIKVSGLIDPVVKDHLIGELTDSPDNLVAVVLWINSGGSVLDHQDFGELAQAMDQFEPTLAAWVGQPGATALGGAAELVGLADIVGVAPGSTIGATGPRRAPEDISSNFGDAATRLTTSRVGAEEAIRLGISIGPSGDMATIGTFLTHIPGYETLVCTVASDDNATSDGAIADDDGGTGRSIEGPSIRTIPLTTTQISALPLIAGFFHTVASPEVAYLFFVIGLGLLLFELYTAGVGIAGVLGAIFVALGSYGLAVLPIRWWALVLLVGAFAALAVDIQTNVPRLYTVVGLGMFTIGSVLLYDGVSMSWVTLIAGLVGAVLYAYTGMPSMVRTRFSTPTIGRRWMIGKLAQAVTDVSPEGTIVIGDAKWRAITNRATPIGAGDTVRVVGLDRLLLEVEPQEGGAKDYRDRGKASDD